jgi:hypothetical protein
MIVQEKANKARMLGYTIGALLVVAAVAWKFMVR